MANANATEVVYLNSKIYKAIIARQIKKIIQRSNSRLKSGVDKNSKEYICISCLGRMFIVKEIGGVIEVFRSCSDCRTIIAVIYYKGDDEYNYLTGMIEKFKGEHQPKDKINLFQRISYKLGNFWKQICDYCRAY